MGKDKGLVGENKTKHGTAPRITVYNRLAGLGSGGEGWTGGTLITYQGSCDTTHSVFSVLLLAGMDLTEIEKQKDGTTYMHATDHQKCREGLLGKFL